MITFSCYLKMEKQYFDDDDDDVDDPQGTSPGASDLFSSKHRAEKKMNLLLRPINHSREGKVEKAKRNVGGYRKKKKV